jgi:hypothetical protein
LKEKPRRDEKFWKKKKNEKERDFKWKTLNLFFIKSIIQFASCSICFFLIVWLDGWGRFLFPISLYPPSQPSSRIISALPVFAFALRMSELVFFVFFSLHIKWSLAKKNKKIYKNSQNDIKLSFFFQVLFVVVVQCL